MAPLCWNPGLRPPHRSPALSRRVLQALSPPGPSRRKGCQPATRRGGAFPCRASPPGALLGPEARVLQPPDLSVLLPTDPPLLIGISSPWPSCLRNGLRSPADWRSPFYLLGAGQTPCVWFMVGTSGMRWVSSPSASLPTQSPPRIRGSPSRVATLQVNFSGINFPRKLGGWARGVSAELVRNAPPIPAWGESNTQAP